jgi:hypothetical protein
MRIVNLLLISHCLGGFNVTSNLLAGKLFKNLKIPVKETHAHMQIIIRLSLPRWMRRNF